ncbi:unnamed protein product [Somion occarium]|uniref:Uncharacterized protein n=1 Tax=Somion occarium TaxID=3059160 RepID=A0ABP1DAM5_9APHY
MLNFFFTNAKSKSAVKAKPNPLTNDDPKQQHDIDTVERARAHEDTMLTDALDLSRPSLTHGFTLSHCRRLTRPVSSMSSNRSRKRSCPEMRTVTSEELEQSIQRIGAVFHQRSSASLRSDSVCETTSADGITQLRHVPGASTHTPTLIVPERATSSGSTLENGVVPEVLFTDDFSEDEDIISEFSGSTLSLSEELHDIAPSALELSPRDYLNVEIPDSSLSAPAEMYGLMWGCNPRSR